MKIALAVWKTVASLTRRPGKRTSAKYVYVQVRHGLAAIATMIDRYAKPFLQAFLTSNFPRREQKMTQQGRISLLGLS